MKQLPTEGKKFKVVDGAGLNARMHGQKERLLCAFAKRLVFRGKWRQTMSASLCGFWLHVALGSYGDFSGFRVGSVDSCCKCSQRGG